MPQRKEWEGSVEINAGSGTECLFRKNRTNLTHKWTAAYWNQRQIQIFSNEKQGEANKHQNTQWFKKKNSKTTHKKIPQETNLLDKNESRGLQESGSVWSKTTSLKKQNIMHISRI